MQFNTTTYAQLI